MIHFKINGERLEYQIWWDEDIQSIKIIMERITEREEIPWSFVCKSSSNRNWWPMPCLNNGLYRWKLLEEDGNLLLAGMDWIGKKKKVVVEIEPWRSTEYFKVSIISPIPLGREDFWINRGERRHVRPASMTIKTGKKESYGWEFLILGRPEKLSVEFSDIFKKCLGKPEICMKR